MPKFKDITGQKFTRLTTISFEKIHNGKRFRTFWICKCDCGKIVKVSSANLTNGGTKSCGCYNYDMHFKHGHSINRTVTKEFESWCAAKSRCYRIKDKSYPLYGGRGIIMCDRWKNSFNNFFQDMGKCPGRMTLDRINSNGNYEPGNCKWSTHLEQSNNKRNNIKIIHNNIIKTGAQWAREIGVSSSTIYRRFKAGLPIDKPVKIPGRKGKEFISNYSI